MYYLIISFIKRYLAIGKLLYSLPDGCVRAIRVTENISRRH